MGRLFAFVLCMLLLPAPGGEVPNKPVLFSVIFPRLVPEATLPDGAWDSVEALLDVLFGEGEPA